MTSTRRGHVGLMSCAASCESLDDEKLVLSGGSFLRVFRTGGGVCVSRAGAGAGEGRSSSCRIGVFGTVVVPEWVDGAGDVAEAGAIFALPR